MISVHGYVRFSDEFTVQFTVKYTNNLAHAHYHPCNEYQAAFSSSPLHTKKRPGDEASSACAVAEGVSAAVVNHGSIEGRPSHGQRSPFKLSLAKRKRGMLITSPREEQDLREYRIPCKPLWSHLFQASPGGHFVRDATWIKLGHKNHSTSR